MKKLLRRIGSAGIDANTGFDRAAKVRVFNYAMLVILLVSLFYSTVALLGGYYIGLVVTCFSCVSALVCFLLVRRQQYDAAFHYSFIYGFIFLCALSFLFGRVNNSHYYFLFMPVAVHFLFDSRRTTVIYSLLCAAFLMVNVYVMNTVDPFYKMQESMQALAYPNMLFVILLIYFGVGIFKQDNADYRREVEKQKQLVEIKNEEITQSIRYARNIQRALLPPADALQAEFPESFVIFKPKDIVSGDFYWTGGDATHFYYATADCTGHGVPGGFMSMLGTALLNELIDERKTESCGEVLTLMREKIMQALKQADDSDSKDGMDMVLVRIHRTTLAMQYAAANNSFYILRKGELLEMPCDKMPVGIYHSNVSAFTSREFQLEKNDCIYTFTDGFADQFGGEKGKKFGYRRLRELLLQTGSQPAAVQQQELEKAFTAWKAGEEQVDDVCVIGVRI